MIGGGRFAKGGYTFDYSVYIYVAVIGKIVLREMTVEDDRRNYSQTAPTYSNPLSLNDWSSS